MACSCAIGPKIKSYEIRLAKTLLLVSHATIVRDHLLVLSYVSSKVLGFLLALLFVEQRIRFSMLLTVNVQARHRVCFISVSLSKYLPASSALRKHLEYCWLFYPSSQDHLKAGLWMNANHTSLLHMVLLRYIWRILLNRGLYFFVS